ncbi:MAG: prealbumin-like fold domain-containing protein [Chloroflexia bacterium]|nr:prealbumin-like fold domain-containing protein [Chloroflexia bacterium]
MTDGHRWGHGADGLSLADGGRSRFVRAMAVVTLALGLLASFGVGGGAAQEVDTSVGTQESGPRDSGPATIEVHLAVCAAGYAGNDFYADCHGNGVPDVGVALQSAAGVDLSDITEVVTSPGPGVAAVGELPAGEYTVTIDIPGDNNTFESYCAQGDETFVPVTPEDDKTATFTLGAGQLVVCDFYVIPADQGQPDGTARIDLDVLACPVGQGYDSDAVDADGFATGCTEAVVDVGFTLTDQGGNERTARSDAAGAVSFGDLPPGTYRLVSEVPGEFAREYPFCTVDGDIYQNGFDSTETATFADLTTEQITCDWYIVPEDLRGASASLTVHLGVCPVGYDGENAFADCHDEGIADQEFFIEGADGETRTATTSLPATPGPGVARFGELLGGDYSLFGGPPGDFVDIRVGCTVDATDARLDISVADGRAALTIDDGQAVTCDWYAIPEDQSGLVPTAVSTQPALTVTTLPSTGAGVHGEPGAGSGPGWPGWSLMLAGLAASLVVLMRVAEQARNARWAERVIRC